MIRINWLLLLALFVVTTCLSGIGGVLLEKHFRKKEWESVAHYPGHLFLRWYELSRTYLRYDKVNESTDYSLVSLHHFPAANATELVSRELKALEAFFSAIYGEGTVHGEEGEKAPGWWRDDYSVTRAMKSAHETGRDFGNPRLSAGYAVDFRDGRCAVVVDSSNSWVLFYSYYTR